MLYAINRSYSILMNVYVYSIESKNYYKIFRAVELFDYAIRK